MTNRIKTGTPVVLKNKGSQYSEVASEVECTYLEWLTAGQWQEAALLEGINCNSFHLSFEQDVNKIEVTLENDDCILCAPLCWVRGETPYTEAEFKLDCALLLLHIAAKGIEPDKVEKIKSFIRKFLL